MGDRSQGNGLSPAPGTRRTQAQRPSPSGLGPPHRCVLITGSEGLIGRALRTSLGARGWDTVGLDLRGSGSELGDVRDRHRVRDAVAGCSGIVHLAAVSRVLWGERDPDTCQDTNVGGVRRVLEAAHAAAPRPWILFASSREVYGHPRRLPVEESAPLLPVNVYGRSKVEGERLVEGAQANGLKAATVRLSNVYGRVLDHPDRVVPAFARAAVEGSAIRIDGAECIFDFTHIDDVVRGMISAIDRLDAGQKLPPVHLVTGVPTSLRELADLALSMAGGTAPVTEAPPRAFDVARFYGNPSRARKVLDWVPRVALRQGLAELARDFRHRMESMGTSEGRAGR